MVICLFAFIMVLNYKHTASETMNINNYRYSKFQKKKRVK